MKHFLNFVMICGFALSSGALLAAESDSQKATQELVAVETAENTEARRLEEIAQAEVAAKAGDVENFITNAMVESGNPGLVTATEVIGQTLRLQLFGMSLGHLVLSFVILAAGVLFRNVLSRAVINRVVRFAERSPLLDVKFVLALTRPLSMFLLIAAVYVALMVLPMDPVLQRFLGYLFRGLTMITAVWGALLLTDVIGSFIEKRLGERPGSALVGFAPLMKKTMKVFVLMIGVLMTVDNLGYNVTGILATLGLGTAAIALASQDTIKNAFGALMIAVDRPFKVGDWIQVSDKVDGDVESIGLRSTKVRTWPKTVLSIPNGVLANEYINNWSQMPKRRVKQVVGLTYEATAEDMEAAVEDIREILRGDEGVEQQFILVNFTDFGESSLDILVYYFTKTVAWLEHMDVRQRVNCKIMRAIQARGLSIAFPTRSLYFEGSAASKMAGVPYESRWESRGDGAGGGLPGDFGPDTPP